MHTFTPGAAPTGTRVWPGSQASVPDNGIALFRRARQPRRDRRATACPHGCNLQHTTLFTDTEPSAEKEAGPRMSPAPVTLTKTRTVTPEGIHEGWVHVDGGRITSAGTGRPPGGAVRE